MKTKSILPILTLASFALVSCSNDKSEGAGAGTDEGGDPYPLTTCVVSGEKLGSMGEPFLHEHEGTTVKFCCESCLPEFEKDPAKFLAKLQK